jgi:hypothetical protein
VEGDLGQKPETELLGLGFAHAVENIGGGGQFGGGEGGERWKSGIYNGMVAVGWCVRKRETGERILGQKANIEPLGSVLSVS